MTDSKQTQRLANPNWKPSNVSAQAVVEAMHALAGTGPAAVRPTTMPRAESMAATQPLPRCW